MSSSIKKISKKKPRNGADYRPLDAATLSAIAETAKGKLRAMDEYRQCRPRELNELARDLTDVDALKTKWFAMMDEEEGGGGVQRGKNVGRVQVKLFLADPYPYVEARSELTHSGAVASGGEIEPNFEQFCSYGINTEAALQVGDQYLKWVPSSLVIPRGTKIRDGDGGPRSIGDEIPIDLGETDKLDQLLELIVDYNGRSVYIPVSNNSKTFVRQALRILEIPAPILLTVFDRYEQRIKDARDPIIPERFRDHRDLDNYYLDRRDNIVKNKRSVEYMFFLCVCYHVRRAHSVNGGGRLVCKEKDCCLAPLLSDLRKAEAELIFNDFWRKFSTNEE